jgi:hypothetical protein
MWRPGFRPGRFVEIPLVRSSAEMAASKRSRCSRSSASIELMSMIEDCTFLPKRINSFIVANFVKAPDDKNSQRYFVRNYRPGRGGQLHAHPLCGGGGPKVREEVGRPVALSAGLGAAGVPGNLLEAAAAGTS